MISVVLLTSNNTSGTHGSLGEGGAVSLTLPVPAEGEILHAENASLRCAFWDAGDWSTEGCVTTEVTPAGVSCRCDHLTTFGLILAATDYSHPAAGNNADVAQDEKTITALGCVVSVIALTMTAVFLGGQICAAVSKPQVRTRINFHLTVNLLVVEILVVISLRLEGSDSAFSRSACTAVAVCLHYFLLTTFAWMLLAGSQIYVMLIKVFSENHPSTSMVKYKKYGSIYSSF